MVLMLGMGYHTLKRRLTGLQPIAKDGRAVFYCTKDALHRIYEVKENERERLDRVRADKIAFDLSVSRKTHLSLTDVEALLSEAAAIFMGQKRSMGSRLAGQLASMSDPKAILALLNSENDAILRDTADKFSEIKDKRNA